MSAKDLEVVVFGATGVTGRRAAGYLASCGVGRWAVAARDRVRTERVLAEEGVSAPEIIEADVTRPESLEAIATRARVVLNFVGPYARYAQPLIRACVAGGAHYADLSGEMPFLRRTIEEFQAPAMAAGVKVVQPCGFESLPPDLAVRLAAETARAQLGEPLENVELEVRLRPPPGLPRPSDGISGGTFGSMIVALEEEDPRTILDPAALIEDPQRAAAVRLRSPIALAPRRGTEESVLAPMTPVAYINPAVIQRTAALAEPDAPPPRYREGVALGGSAATLPLRWAAAGALAGVQVALRAGLKASSPQRRRIARALGALAPPSGYGPQQDRLEGWTWSMLVRGHTAHRGTVEVRVDASGHPGYLATARMLAEAGLLMAEEGATPALAGCLPPALAFGTATLLRFERAGMSFSASLDGA